MSKYFFLDNWIYSRLTSSEFERRLSAFVHDRHLTILVTSLSLVELYNHGWQTAGVKDRMALAARFISQHPCVIVHPPKVFEAEIKLYPDPVPALPLELDLGSIPEAMRYQTLMAFLRGEQVFVQQGLDIEKWSEGYGEQKESWLDQVKAILDDAYSNGTLEQDEKGKVIKSPEYKERSLLSLDLRHVNPEHIDALLAKRLERVRQRIPLELSAIRISSLCFWYAYVEIDQASKMKHRGSDIGDFYQISLIPYCAAFTTDGAMYRMLRRIRDSVIPVSCDVITPRKIERYLSAYKATTSA